MAEVVVSTMLIGILMTTSLQSVGVSLRRQVTANRIVVANNLASGLMSEIMAQSYMEPTLSSSAIVREAGEDLVSRTAYDDVDDYNGWTATPPQTKSGTVLTNYTGWQSAVTVEWITLATLLTSVSETNTKRITVTMSLNGTVMATRVALRTNSQ